MRGPWSIDSEWKNIGSTVSDAPPQLGSTSLTNHLPSSLHPRCVTVDSRIFVYAKPTYRSLSPRLSMVTLLRLDPTRYTMGLGQVALFCPIQGPHSPIASISPLPQGVVKHFFQLGLSSDASLGPFCHPYNKYDSATSLEKQPCHNRQTRQIWSQTQQISVYAA